MMDTVGAIAGPATAFLLLPLLSYNYHTLFSLTLVPGLLAALAIGFIKEQARKPVTHVSLGEESACGRCPGLLPQIPGGRRPFSAAGDFAHSR